MKKEYLEEYLKIIREKIPELIDMIHGINKLSNNYIFEFQDLDEFNKIGDDIFEESNSNSRPYIYRKN